MDARLASYLARLPSPVESVDPLARSAPEGEPFAEQLRSMGLHRRIAWLLGAHAAETAVMVAGWTCIGAGALSGRVDRGWLTAWALCLASAVLLRAVIGWNEGVLAIGTGGLLKRRLLTGAMAIEADLVRRKGAGELLGEVLEAEQIDRLGVTSAIEAALAVLHLLAASWILAWGSAARLQLALLAAWSCAGLAALVHNARVRERWTAERFALTHRFVESMAAHRTRAVQQRPSDWHTGEDAALAAYADRSNVLDRSTARIEAAWPRAYLMTAADAIRQPTDPGEPSDGLGGPGGIHETLRALSAHEVTFTHQGRIEPAVRGGTLTIAPGDVVLLEGASGSGKSTFAALLGGARVPSSGVILSGGLDRQTLGEASWRRRVALAPAPHENHLLSAPLGFNLLLGRPLPHSARDLEEARTICVELGLGGLLERMPAGLDQMVGETGWQLSQGECSRVFLARALLQGAGVVVLDESLGALDPGNVEQCLNCVIRRARSALLIAHP